MKPANKWIQIGRILGIVHIVIPSGFMLYSFILAMPRSEETVPAILFIMISAVFIAIFSFLLHTARRKEILGGILYLVLGVLPVPLLVNLPLKEMALYILLFIPTISTGVLFLVGGLQKRKLVAVDNLSTL